MFPYRIGRGLNGYAQFQAQAAIRPTIDQPIYARACIPSRLSIHAPTHLHTHRHRCDGVCARNIYDTYTPNAGAIDHASAQVHPRCVAYDGSIAKRAQPNQVATAMVTSNRPHRHARTHWHGRARLRAQRGSTTGEGRRRSGRSSRSFCRLHTWPCPGVAARASKPARVAARRAHRCARCGGGHGRREPRRGGIECAFVCGGQAWRSDERGSGGAVCVYNRRSWHITHTCYPHPCARAHKHGYTS